MNFINSNSFSDDRGSLFVSDLQIDFLTSSIEHIVVRNLKSRTWRGFHWQFPTKQHKFIRVLKGSISDFTVSMDSKSIDYGKLKMINLNSEEKKWLSISHDLAHGYITHEEDTIIEYLIIGKYVIDERVNIRYNDPGIVGIDPNLLRPDVISLADSNIKDFQWNYE